MIHACRVVFVQPHWVTMVVAEVPLWVLHRSETTSQPHSSAPNVFQEALNRWSLPRQAIYSVDVSGSILATAGGDVRIWTTEAFFIESGGKVGADGAYVSSETDDEGRRPVTNQPATASSVIHDLSGPDDARLLKTLTADASVFCVRFSPNGQHLATAGDDVAVYHVSDWSRWHVGKAHQLDVVDLVWSPDGQYLASCSLDSQAPICVWKLGGPTLLMQPFRVLGQKEHTSLVKGIAWDPAGTYLATSGDDQAVCLWRTQDWSLEVKVPTPGTTSGLVRRLSWATDGSCVCATGAVVQKKNVCRTIGREDWAKESANLVGHKAAIVCSRSCPQLVREGEDSHANLIALGDQRGFITVWSTRKTRPLFKMQCSEGRYAVTDLAWGRIRGELLLMVSHLDGRAVALKFSVPSEIGPFLSQAELADVFSSRYGIDMDASGGFLMPSNGESRLIESTLQMSLEQSLEKTNKGMTITSPTPRSVVNQQASTSTIAATSTVDVRSKQVESRSKGKKRIMPVLMNVEPKKPNVAVDQPQQQSTSTDPVQSARDAAEKAAAITEAATLVHGRDEPRSPPSTRRTTPETPRPHGTPSRSLSRSNHGLVPSVVVSHKVERSLAVDLPLLERSALDQDLGPRASVSCTNTSKVPMGARNNPVACVDLKISIDGKVTWKDQFPGTFCSAVSASRNALAVGTTDGTLQLFAPPPLVGWKEGSAFRSHPPLVIGHAVVAVHLYEKSNSLELIVVGGDGFFGVYSLLPTLRLRFKGSILPAMHNMVSGSTSTHGEQRYPELARIQLTDSGDLLLLLSFASSSTPVSSMYSPSRSSGRTESTSSHSVGGSLQGFVYNHGLELWMRMSDSRFILSDFYSSLPGQNESPSGPLSHLNDLVCFGSHESSLQPTQRAGKTAGVIFDQTETSGNFVPTRAHCEDRMACAFALGSNREFKHWMAMYARTLALGGQEESIRSMVHSLLGIPEEDSADHPDADSSTGCWWLLREDQILGMARKDLVTDVVLPEVGRNRALQRLAKEISLEIDAM